MSDLKMYRVIVNIPVPAMVYAKSKSQAYARLREEHVEVREASALEIASFVRAGGVPLGEPSPGDDRQPPSPAE